jgi:predicted nucleic acid-binding protein
VDKDPRLSYAACKLIDDVIAAASTIGLSSISLAEILYLVEKKRIPADAYTAIAENLSDPDWTFTELVVDRHITNTMQRVSREQVPDLPDRVIAATALRFDIPLITADAYIRASSVETIW